MNAKRDDFDEVIGEAVDEAISVAFREPSVESRRDEGDRWPAAENVTRIFALRDLEQGKSGRPKSSPAVQMDEEEETIQLLPVRRTARSSSPEIPLAAKAPWPATRTTSSYEAATLTSLEEAEHCDEGLQIEIEVGTYEGDAEDDRDDDADRDDDRDDDADYLVGRAYDAGAEGSVEGATSYQGEDATDEDAWWMSIDSGLLAEGSIDEELDLPPPPGVIAQLAVTSTSLDERLLEVLLAPVETQCSCGHDCDQREQALRAELRELSSNESRALRYRLNLARRDDKLAAAFATLPAEHRARLMAFLDHHASREVFEGPNWRAGRKG